MYIYIYIYIYKYKYIYTYIHVYISRAGPGEEPRANLADIATVWSSPLALGIVAFATLTLPKEQPS